MLAAEAGAGNDRVRVSRTADGLTLQPNLARVRERAGAASILGAPPEWRISEGGAGEIVAILTINGVIPDFISSADRENVLSFHGIQGFSDGQQDLANTSRCGR